MRTNVKLAEVGEDFEILIRGYAGRPDYKVTKKLVLRRKCFRITEKKLREIVKGLQERYPDKGYYLVGDLVRHKWLANLNDEWMKRKFWIFGRKEEKGRGIPIYYSTTLGKLYIPSSYVARKYKLVCSVLSYRLRDLGILYSMQYVR